jgi:hypothetical protein
MSLPDLSRPGLRQITVGLFAKIERKVLVLHHVPEAVQGKPLLMVFVDALTWFC